MSPKILDKLILMARGCNSLRDVADLMNADANASNPEDDIEKGSSTPPAGPEEFDQQDARTEIRGGADGFEQIEEGRREKGSGSSAS